MSALLILEKLILQNFFAFVNRKPDYMQNLNRNFKMKVPELWVSPIEFHKFTDKYTNILHEYFLI